MFNCTATTEIYTLSLHDALPIYAVLVRMHELDRILDRDDVAEGVLVAPVQHRGLAGGLAGAGDRKSTRLNSSHLGISYAVFCLKKKKNHELPYALDALRLIRCYH